jgi:integrase
MANYLTKRGGFWRFCRRIPDEYAALDRRGIVQQSTKVRIVDDPRGIRAREVALRMNDALEKYWRDLANAGTAQAVADYHAASKAAKRMNISPPDTSAQRTIAELLARVEQLERGKQMEDRPSVLAVYDLLERPVMTFQQCAEQYVEAHKGSWSSQRHVQQWQNSLAQYAYPVLADLPIVEIDGNSKGTDLVMRVIEPLWSRKTTTASHLRGRIENIIDWATVRGYREGANPARWRGHLDKLLPAKTKIAPTKHHAALPYADMPEFMRKLRAEVGTTALALEFAILTVARISEALGARRSEIDRKASIWVVPAARMKARKEHRVPLSDAALAIIDAAPKGDYLFPGPLKKPLSEMAVRLLFKRLGVSGEITRHGFRSAFNDWAAETTDHPNELIKMALAHTVGDKVEAAYRRGDMLAKRHQLMRDWEAYCNGVDP